MANPGAELTFAEPGRPAIRPPFGRERAQQDGFCHGGMVAAGRHFRYPF
ncbi:MAG: hypothetical protein ACHQZQ_04185 [SAR324 cluster bacterium]